MEMRTQFSIPLGNSPTRGRGWVKLSPHGDQNEENVVPIEFVGTAMGNKAMSPFTRLVNFFLVH